VSNSISALSILASNLAGHAGNTGSPPLTVLGFAAAQSAANNSGAGGSVFDAIATSAAGGNSIQSILNNQQTQQTRTQFFNNVANYLKALQTGQITPGANTPTWQTNAAYLQKTGQPFVVTVDNKGQPQVALESDADLSRYTPAEQVILSQAFGTLSTMAQKIQANTTNQNWLDTLNGVEPTLQAIHQGYGVPQPGWEQQATSLAAIGSPFKVVLDGKGNLTIENQFLGQFSDASATAEPILAAAVGQLQTALRSGITTTAWESQALTYANQGQDYYLDVDPVTNNIVVKTNSGANIVPSFLKTPPYSNIGANTPWLQQAAGFIQQGTGFYLDVGNNGQVVARQNDGHGINTFNQPRYQAIQNPIVNLLL
jgi:hypothetical protein